jgi:hypothetical protein
MLFLLAHGRLIRALKAPALGHNISNLMVEAIGLGLIVSPTTRSDIDLLSEAHRKFWPRYPKQTGGTVFLIDQFDKPFVELLTAVALAIRGGNRLWVQY